MMKQPGMMKQCKRSARFVLCMFVLIALAALLHAEGVREASLPSARIILFVPDGSKLPPASEPKLRSIALRTESFFAKEIAQWGWKVGRSKIFARNKKGDVDITVVRGALPDSIGGRDALPVIMKRAMTQTNKKPGGDAFKGVWWVFYHCPDYNVRGFQGGGGRNGGRAINAYPIAEGTVAPDVDLAAETMWPLKLKGCIHEFGHALGLPHIGPRPSVKRGNTLMGPVNKAFAAKAPGKKLEPRVYLSEASAAMLAKHPLFTSGTKVEAVRPCEIEVSNFSFEETPAGDIKVKGIVKSNVGIHSAVVLDSPRGFGDYWARSYCAKVGGGGKFSVVVSDPLDGTRGILSLFFSLADGRNSATGKREVLHGDRIEIRYEGDAGKRKFTKQPPTRRPRRRKAQATSKGGQV